ncbi:MAG: phosphomethylpyrimidine synthase ThiC, partial [Candidatus Aminicenantaceae bacterium]
MTQLEKARKGTKTKTLKKIAQEENIDEDKCMELVSQGKIVIPYNVFHKSIIPIGIGKELRTKVNVNIGTSMDLAKEENELKKVDISLKYNADTIMDLSTGGDIQKIRKKILDKSTMPLGTVPVYQAAINAIEERGSIVDMHEDDLFSVIESQAKEGVDFMTVHAGLTTKAIDRLKKQKRIADIVSRGG